MSRYPFPNVPKAPGVPQVPRSPAFPNTTPPVLGTALALGRLVLALTRSSGWGVYRDFSGDDAAARRDFDRRHADTPPDDRPAFVGVVRGSSTPVLVPDSFVNFGQRQEFSVTTAPTEQGGFASYNKVNNPFEVQLRMSKGGSLRERTEFLGTLEKIANSTDLYKIVTPEKTYYSVNINRYEVTRREAKGAYFLSEIDVFFTEIRTVVSEYTNTTFNTTDAAQASDTPTQNFGTVQAAPGGPT